jgi:hypothetical protein
MRFALPFVALSLIAGPAFAGGPQARAAGPTAGPGRSDVSGRAPSPLESGVVAFELPQDIADLLTGQGVRPGLLYKGIQIGLTQRTVGIPVTLCLAQDHVFLGDSWDCKRAVAVQPRDVNRGDTPENLADMIQTGGAYRLYWKVPPAAPDDSRPRREEYTEWSKPFRVRGAR